MEPDLWTLYQHMLLSRRFQVEVTKLWKAGLISGEMHLGVGEEAIAAGIVTQLNEGDAMALDHRGTPQLLMRGVDPVCLLQELLGRADGLCRGMGGHMHLFSPAHLAASSGIVGSSGPAGAGFALAAKVLRPGSISLAFFGEGAFNEGALMEAMNLAVAWQLPLLFVCKDNQWSIATHSPDVRGGDLNQRAQSFGMPAVDVDGSDVEAVWHAARDTIARLRSGGGPAFFHAHCRHLEGHYLGYQVLRIARNPVQEVQPLIGGWVKSLTRRKGAPLRERMASLKKILSLIYTTKQESNSKSGDPVYRARQRLLANPTQLQAVEEAIEVQIQEIVQAALAPCSATGTNP